MSLYTGSFIRESNGWDSDNRMILGITSAEYKTMVGRAFNGLDVVWIYNGDYRANPFTVTGFACWNSSNFWCDTKEGVVGQRSRINVKVVAIDFD